MQPAHRERLLACGVEAELLADLPLRLSTEGLPERWHEQGNALYLHEEVRLPQRVLDNIDAYGCSDALIVVSTGIVDDLLLLTEGHGATMFLGPRTFLAAGSVYCGGESRVIFEGDVSATGQVAVDARNGGSVVVAPDQLWANNVYIATDDMHRLEDLETGARLNPYGAHIRIGQHVWLGRDVVLSGHVDIGDGCVVGLGSFVRGQKIAPNTAVAGSPARVIREGVAWRIEDTP